MGWFDAGVNLLDKRFDPVAIVENAIAAGVTKMCVITTLPDEWEPASELAKAYPDNLVFTVGIHPHHAKSAKPDDFTELAEFLKHPQAVAVGECGLDFNRNFSPQDVQCHVFEKQLQIALEVNKPVYLHERDAFEQQISILAQYADRLKGGVAHCFTGSKDQLEAYLNMGLYIGITGWLCDDKRNQSLVEAVKFLPQDRFLLETDAPYLFPKNRRPRVRNNEPAFLPCIADKLSEVLNITSESLRRKSYANTCKLFGLID
ncbi:TatD family hydrolase [Alteromonas sp. ASW11-130]|uniref:TatD family hydrolase n=1 Tax=Alteromonas sp. ASW11-130 TaxID=3015775 RepID=UPI00224285A6|nr:TatD family hydrolase [Alteromonas sp. ASW11-130]MCW8090870.1 TatD family hydrolase [Alteromonas sp. ASW11-130]